jgi:hypothetical protein
MVAASEVAVIRRAQQAISDAVTRELTDLFASLDLSRPEAARDALLEVVPLLVSEYGDEAAVYAAEWYDEVRAAEGVPGRFRARPAPLAGPERVEQTVRRAAGELFGTTPELMLPAVLDKVTKYVLEPGRQTIVDSTARDPRAVGWQRVARAGGCDFCRMLAGRGGVYKERTASFAAHGHCNCASVPSWDRSAPEVDVRAYEASKRTSTMSPAQREAHTARVRDWIASNLD